MEQQLVWAPDPVEGYVFGEIVDISTEVVTVKCKSKNEIIKAPYTSLYPADPETSKHVADNCALMFLNEATLLNNLRIRYEKDLIYTYVANILISINPYFEVKNLYSSETIKKYQGKSLGLLPPHVYAIADKAFRDMRALKQSQSIIVSGESGAGKTESTKHVLRYLCESWGTNSGQIERLILAANPVLEAFGNAKTVRNNNSSRFGKFIEIHFNGKYAVVGGFISHYLLEKSRICGQSSDERNYHIFYQLCAGLPSEIWSKLHLSSPDAFYYLKRGCTQYFGGAQSSNKIASNRLSSLQQKKGSLKDAIVDDYHDFMVTDAALTNFGVQDKISLYKLVASVLHLGNIEFEEMTEDTRGGCQVKNSDTSVKALETAADLMGIEAEELQQCLLSRIMQTSKGGHKGTVYLVPLKVHEASSARDALAKALYSRLFDHIVTNVINKSIPYFQSAYYIGVLDIAGFEYFRHNSFEQFCINYCNEKLQQVFNERILREEQILYEKEGLGLKQVNYIDNSDCIALLEGKTCGIFDLLDEESKLPKPSSTHFTESVFAQNKDHFRLAVPRKSKLKNDRELRDDEGFLIRHFAGAVCYQTSAFIEKNNDALHNSLQSLMSEAKNDLIRQLFCSSNQTNGGGGGGKLTFVSVGGKFRNQLNELVNKLRSTGTHFIRCIKPNLHMVPHKFEGSQILSQLRCSGMASVLELMQQGYPSRTSFVELYNLYKHHLPPKLIRLEPRMFCRTLFKALGLNENDYKFGSSKVFFRSGKFAEFDQLMKSDPQHLTELVGKVSKWLIISRWKMAQWCALCTIKLRNKILYRKQMIITIQSNTRMYLAKKKYRPRYMSIIKVKKIIQMLQDVYELIGKLKSSSEQSKFKDCSDKMNKDAHEIVKYCKTSPQFNEKQVLAKIDAINDTINAQLNLLRSKIKEEEKLLKMQQLMDAERRKKEEEERKKREEEDLKRKRIQLDERFKLEISSKKIDDHELALKLQKQMDEEAAQLKIIEQKRLEQEALDHELALRLAQESSSSSLASSSSSSSCSSNGLNDELLSPNKSALSPSLLGTPIKVGADKKYDLSKWKYSDLRDIINTSCDIELLEACKEEFHRRLKVYHAWKLKNSRNKEVSEELRAPDSIMHNPGPIDAHNNDNLKSRNEQRYFRIPFVRPSSATGQRGWWWAHFDGQWIAKQMEIHPEKKPILLVAGQDDMQMCELSLDETRLTTKRGAEILAEEFEKEWIKNGGASVKYSPSNRKR